MAMSKITRPSRMRAAERRAQALELRKAGATVTEIAAALSMSRQGIEKMLHKALADLTKQSRLDAESLRELELARLDMVCLALAQQVKGGHHGAIDRWIRASERRAKLLGLDTIDAVQAQAILRTYEGVDLDKV